MKYRTIEEYVTKSGGSIVTVPKGANVVTMHTAVGLQYNVRDPRVDSQRSPHDRKYRYVTVPSHLVEELKKCLTPLNF